MRPNTHIDLFLGETETDCEIFLLQRSRPRIMIESVLKTGGLLRSQARSARVLCIILSSQGGGLFPEERCLLVDELIVGVEF